MIVCFSLSQGPHIMGDLGHLEAWLGDRAQWLMFPIQPQMDYNVACFLQFLHCSSNQPASHLISIKWNSQGQTTTLSTTIPLHQSLRPSPHLFLSLCSSFVSFHVGSWCFPAITFLLLSLSSLLVSRILSCGAHFSYFFLCLLSSLPYAQWIFFPFREMQLFDII